MASPATQPVSDLSDEEFERRILDAIVREFGPAGLPRFLMAFRSGHADYTADRHQWLATLTLDGITEDLKNHP